MNIAINRKYCSFGSCRPLDKQTQKPGTIARMRFSKSAIFLEGGLCVKWGNSAINHGESQMNNERR
jgi:hypothetical protein